MSIEKERQFQTTWGGMVAAYLFLGGVGAGAYVVGAVAGLLDQGWRPVLNAGLGLSFPLVMIGLVFLLAHLGSPSRSFLAASRLGSSWISRGVVIVSAFLALAVIHFLGQVAPFDYVSNAPAGSPLPVVLSIAGILCGLFVMLYTGALLSASKGYPLWRTGVLPVLFMVSALFTGLLADMIAVALADASTLMAIQYRNLALAGVGLIVVELLVIFFFLHSAYRTDDSREAAEAMAKSPSFIAGDLVAGLLVPLVIFLVMYFGMADAAPKTLAAAGIAAGVLGLMGGFLLRSAVLAAGMQTSLEAAGFKFRTPSVAPPREAPAGRLPPQ
ncbi:MAG: polysulfide reductase NrfD [Planctomycetes bacterium]|nr:polysulfide reductase NrfD [Planctomycetota bacterium]